MDNDVRGIYFHPDFLVSISNHISFELPILINKIINNFIFNKDMNI